MAVQQGASEFELIRRYFVGPVPANVLGPGDDCALIPISASASLAISSDMLLEGRHFLSATAADAVGHKALAVNLSDLAAMGARPVGCTLALALPRVDHAWLAGFSAGFQALAQQTGCPLVGGDTTRSDTGSVISVTVLGLVDPQQALRRDAARAGDDIWVSGSLGAADVALRLLQGELATADTGLLQRLRPYLEYPQARLELGQALLGVAHAAIDISDGLRQDLGHILQASACGATLYYDALPQHPDLAGLAPELRQQAVLAGGDVYELCFTASPAKRTAIAAIGQRLGLQLSRVGTINSQRICQVLDGAGKALELVRGGFDHFA